jgi:hypothetical protein
VPFKSLNPKVSETIPMVWQHKKGNEEGYREENWNNQC